MTLCMIALPLLGRSLSNVSVETSIGNLNIVENIELRINYHFYEKAAIKFSGYGGKLENRPTCID